MFKTLELQEDLEYAASFREALTDFARFSSASKHRAPASENEQRYLNASVTPLCRAAPQIYSR